jgi:hypothetical protein
VATDLISDRTPNGRGHVLVPASHAGARPVPITPMVARWFNPQQPLTPEGERQLDEFRGVLQRLSSDPRPQGALSAVD